MKRNVFITILVLIMLLTFTACSSFSVSLNTVGKDNTSALKMAKVVNDDLYAEKRGQNFKLYGISMSMDQEGIGTAQLIYTDKLPQNLKYSDIIIVTIDTRTGKVVSVKNASFSSYGIAPYEAIVHGAPLQIENWSKDSSDARTIAQNTFYGEDNFVYNYLTISASVVNDIEQYHVSFISFVNRLKYNCTIDAMTGAVLSKEITEL